MNEVERVARLIVAEKMGLIRDPQGLRLPDELWRQALPQAITECEANHGQEETQRKPEVGGRPINTVTAR